MKKVNLKGKMMLRFRRFMNRPYAVFCSFTYPVTIGVLMPYMLSFANVESISAQTQNHVDNSQSKNLEEVLVTGSRFSLTLSQTARMVKVLDKKEIEAAPVQSVNDLLKYAVGIDVRQRGGMGVQTDISVRGGTFDQIIILLNGINICDPQTGHNAADFPVEISEIERIEVLEGPAGRAYGTSSLVGAINIITRIENQNSASVHVDGGSYGYFNGGARVNYNQGAFKNQVSGSYVRSDGYSRNKAGKLNSDFTQGKVFYQGSYQSKDVNVQWQGGMNQKDYGANTFYSVASDEQFEHVRKFYAAVQAETQGRILKFKPSLYWNRSEDRFEFYKDDAKRSPFNHHRTDVYGISLNNYLQTILGKTAFGADIRNEGIISTTLGEPLNTPKPIHGTDAKYVNGLNRTNISFHLEHNILIDRFSLSGGIIAVKNTGNEMGFHFYPGVDASFLLLPGLKAYASYNTSLRMPTFTELYYSVGGHKADKYLKPEEMQSVELGLKYTTPALRGALSVYHYHGKNMIDWIKDITQGEDAPWTSVNHTKINTWGVETAFRVDFEEWLKQKTFFQSLDLSYNYLDQDKKAGENIQSKYALEYLKHKFVAQAHLNIWKKLQMHVAYRWQDREGNYQAGNEVRPYQPYSLVDLRLSWKDKRYTIYTDINNLLDKAYYDYGNIPQPGIWVRSGIAVNLNF